MPRKRLSASSSERGGGYLSDLLDIFRLHAEAWQMELSTKAELRILHSQKQLLEARQDLVQTELRARRNITLSLYQGEEDEAQLQLQRTIRSVPAEQARASLQSEIETERLLAEREHLRHLRRSGNAPLPPSPRPEVRALSGSPLETEVSSTQIEALALRAMTRFSQLPPAETEHAWTQWRDELASRFPPYAVEEILRRVTEMQSLLH